MSTITLLLEASHGHFCYILEFEIGLKSVSHSREGELDSTFEGRIVREFIDIF